MQKKKKTEGLANEKYLKSTHHLKLQHLYYIEF